jgi:hypothetical protein
MFRASSGEVVRLFFILENVISRIICKSTNDCSINTSIIEFIA